MGRRTTVLPAVLLVVVLAACGPGPAPRPTPSSPSEPTPAPANPVASEPARPSAIPGAEPPGPTATPDPPTAAPSLLDPLSPDQPWVWIAGSDDNRRCGSLVAVEATGVLTPLRVPVLDTIDRPGAAPLAFACSGTGGYAIVDPVDGRQTQLDPEAGPDPYGFVLSPDGAHVAFAAPSYYQAAGGEKEGDYMQLADLRTGAVRRLADAPTPQEFCHPCEFEAIGWGAHALYVRTQTSTATVIWSIDPTDPQSTLQQRAVIPLWAWAFNSAAELLVYWDDRSESLKLLNLWSGEERVVEPQMPRGHEGLPQPHSVFAIAPDGTSLAYFHIVESAIGQTEWQLVKYDIASGTATVLDDLLYVPLEVGWSADSAYILRDGHKMTVEQGTVRMIDQNRIAVFARDGQLVGDAPAVDQLGGVRFTAGNELLWILADGNGVRLQSVPLDPNRPPRYRAVPLPAEGGARIVYAPPPNRTSAAPDVTPDPTPQSHGSYLADRLAGGSAVTSKTCAAPTGTASASVPARRRCWRSTRSRSAGRCWPASTSTSRCRGSNTRSWPTTGWESLGARSARCS